MTRFRRTVVLLVLISVIIPSAALQAQAKLQNGVDYIIRQFKTCNIVGLGDGGHGNIDIQEFVLQLLSNREIQQTLNGIIVEFASAGYQDVLDRYTSGQNVPFDELKKVWQENGMNADGIWDKPIYQTFLKKVREVNTALPKSKRIRVLAGDPAIDWKTIHTFDELNKSTYMKERDLHPANLAIEYGIKRGQKLLIIYGDQHLRRIDKDSIASSVNAYKPGSIRIVWELDSRIMQMTEKTDDWPRFSVLDLHENEFGDRDANAVSWFYGTNRATDPKWNKLYAGRKVKDIVDAFLYFGPRKDWRFDKVPKAVYQDDAWWAELNRRNQILWGEPLDPKLRELP